LSFRLSLCMTALGKAALGQNMIGWHHRKGDYGAITAR